jgi:hypothetical protein
MDQHDATHPKPWQQCLDTPPRPPQDRRVDDLSAIRQLGEGVVVGLVTRILCGRISEAQSRAIRTLVAQGRIVAGPGSVTAGVVQSLTRFGILAQDPAWETTCGIVGPRLAAACSELVGRSRQPVSGDLVVEYLAALDARRALLTAPPTSSTGRRLGGRARERIVHAAQRRLDAAEAALRASMRTT